MHYLPIQGGQEVYIDSLNKLLDGYGVETDVVQPFSRHAGKRQTNVHTLPRLPYLHRLVHDINWFWFNGMLRFFQRRVKEYDVVISHYAFHADCLKCAKKLIVLSHGVDWRCPPKTMADRYRAYMAMKTAAEKTVIVANDTSYFRTIGLPVKPAEGYFQEVSPNKWFIPNCVDINKYYAGSDKKREKIILVPRNIRWARGIHLAIGAFYHFSKAHPDFKLWIVGGPLSGGYYRHCCDLVRKFDLEARVIFTGTVCPDEIIRYYHRAYLTLIPTVDREGTSLSALESMATKTPVVSTNIGGLLDLPTVQAEPLPEKVAEKLAYVVENYDVLRQDQYRLTRERFNMDLWREAWLKVIQGKEV